MDDAAFLGRVLKHPAYVELETKNPDIKQYTTQFRDYWLLGFSPLVGKDGILPVPDIYSSNAIGRAHVEPPVKTNKSHSSTEKAWELWAIGASDVVPTSNSFLVYCVDDNRNCCLLSFLDDTDSNPHSTLNDPSFRRNIRLRAEEYFRGYGVFPMPKGEHDSLFDEKWIK